MSVVSPLLTVRVLTITTEPSSFLESRGSDRADVEVKPYTRLRTFHPFRRGSNRQFYVISSKVQIMIVRGCDDESIDVNVQICMTDGSIDD